MAMSEAMHRYAEAKLAKAAEVLESAQRSIPTPPEYGNFDHALRIVEECQDAVAGEWELDGLVQHLRAASGRLRHYCGGPAEASVDAAISLIDQAVGGESM
ncbi:MAG: hypothetical protein JWN43_218 [Gammaproteobacteria bacterium]|nr:hypothetical protein [Gammaproteobacteria bacterium]